MSGSRPDRPRRRAEALSRPAVFAVLLSVSGLLVSVWFAKRGMPANDEGALLTAAAKILQGGVFYRDIDSYPFPGAAYLLALGMRLFGEHLSVARGLAAGIYCCAILSLYLASLSLLDRRRAALFGLSLLSFKFLAWPAFTAYMYSDLSFAFGCAAIALLLGRDHRGASWRLALAGACVGVSLASKQNLGIYLAAAAFALLAFPEWLLRAPPRRPRERWSAVLAFGLGLALPLIPMLAYFALQGLLWEMLRSGLVRPFTGYFPTSQIAFAEPLKWWELGRLQGMDGFAYFVGPYWSMLTRDQLPGAGWYPVYWTVGEIFTRALYTSIPVAFVAAVWGWLRAIRRGSVSARDRARFALAVLGFAVLLSAFPRADFFHVASVYPVVLLLLFALRQPAVGETRRSPASARGFRIEAGAVTLLLAVTGALCAVQHSRAIYRLELARADLYVSEPETWIESVVKFIQDEVASDETIFVYGNEAHYYFLADRFYSWPFSQLYPGQTGGDGGETLSELLDREPPKLVVGGLLSWPGLPAIPSYTPVLAAYVREHYQVEERVFRRYPPRAGGAPPGWMVAVLRPRAVESAAPE